MQEHQAPSVLVGYLPKRLDQTQHLQIARAVGMTKTSRRRRQAVIGKTMQPFPAARNKELRRGLNSAGSPLELAEPAPVISLAPKPDRGRLSPWDAP
jgi:hypothetical protein